MKLQVIEKGLFEVDDYVELIDGCDIESSYEHDLICDGSTSRI